MVQWRFISLLDAPGQIQMALDRWLFEQHGLGLHPPVLRFYTWSSATISLGYHQSRYPDHWRSLIWQNQPIPLVQRPTGGRAVLHQGDLTYAVITSGIPGNRMEAYRAVCEFLIQGWRSLQVPLSFGQVGRGYIHNPNCFGTATGADLVLPNGAKLIGSAQRWQGQTILQHGSMPLQTDSGLFQAVFGTPLQDLQLPFHINATQIHRIMDAMMAAAMQSFKMELVVQPLTESEWADVKRFV